MKTVVVGAGPVGALAALYAAKRGDDVEVYELRSDLRKPGTVPLNFTKSINLALSERGINAIREARYQGLLESILDETIPMHGRMIHGEKKGSLFEESQLYDVHGRFIRASDRADLNKALLDELERLPNVKLLFNHKLTGADFERNLAWFERQNELAPTQDAARKRFVEIEVAFDFMVGADGAHSATRFHLMKFARMSFHQEYIDTLWCEFNLPALPTSDSKHGGFALHPNRLHIWPGSHHMFIAIPSNDHSFTCTLFMPVADFTRLNENPQDLVSFFQTSFPGVVPNLIAPEDLQRQYAANPHLPLLSIKCEPYHYGASVVIVGDAAHAMVPFYGQGMNAGLEDVRVLFETLDAFPRSANGRAGALAAYTASRIPDAHTINDLAMGNYREMRADVRSPVYLLRKTLEEALDLYVPWLGFATQYSRVSFGNERYSDVARRVRWQGEVLGAVGGVATGLFALAAGTLGWMGWKRFER